MTRHILNEDDIHPAVRQEVSDNHRSFVEKVMADIDANPVVVLGMKGNPHCAKAVKFLQDIDQPYKYISYGSYVAGWRQRNALKMWTGWKTFPMVFVRGQLIGGATELQKLIKSSELKQLLSSSNTASAKAS